MFLVRKHLTHCDVAVLLQEWYHRPHLLGNKCPKLIPHVCKRTCGMTLARGSDCATAMGSSAAHVECLDGSQHGVAAKDAQPHDGTEEDALGAGPSTPAFRLDRTKVGWTRWWERCRLPSGCHTPRILSLSRIDCCGSRRVGVCTPIAWWSSAVPISCGSSGTRGLLPQDSRLRPHRLLSLCSSALQCTPT